MKDYLPLIPVRNPKVELKRVEGKFCLMIPMDSPFDFLARMLHGDYRRLELDEVGAYVWQLCDGRRNVEEIGRKLREKFGDEVEPLYERLVTFLLQLAKRGLITFKEPE
ncbi:PqqD family protein [Pyrococcus yayanosii]|uniref:PqqD family protein n=1 Tax=Pyrococcus yayanosii (strain CH1 / JCM 16557) TaxID=529709 RepID=F8AHB2_PYRYC|nr:PqqD family protein [Pyrococcus yayanosii]AEH25349.1 hypothetical protein PYCH_16890 [Pyrococcus yayanosii CH1]